MGHSDGAYKANLKFGVSNKFQSKWQKENERHLWLEDIGLVAQADGESKWMARCMWCDVSFASHLGTIKKHEEGTHHCAREIKKHAEAAARQQMQQRLDAMQQHADAQRTKAQRDPSLRTLFSSALRVLQRGRPINDVPHDKEFLLHIDAPNVPDIHWHKNSGERSMRTA